MWELDGYAKWGLPIISGAYQLQRDLTNKGYYNKGANPDMVGRRTAMWLYQSLMMREKCGIWCPSAPVNIE